MGEENGSILLFYVILEKECYLKISCDKLKMYIVNLRENNKIQQRERK